MEKPNRRKWKTTSKILGCIILLAAAFSIYIVCSAFFGFNDDQSTDDLSEYEAYLDTVLSSKKHMPPLDACGVYQKGCLSKREHVQYIFDYYSVGLFLQYSDEEYNRQCEQIEKNYRFYTEPYSSFQNLTANIDGYRVRAVKLDDPSLMTVKACLFIGFNDDLHSILFAFYDDEELDYISDLDDVLKEHFYIPKEWKTK